MEPMEQLVRGAAQRLKVFPLPSVVLFPGTALPLHIFEPRYRALMEDALATDRVLAMAGLKPGWEAQYLGRPPLEPIACAGVVVWEQRAADGTFDLVLQGVSRVRVLEELSNKRLYREVLAEVLVEPSYAGPEEALLRQAVFQWAGRVPQLALAHPMAQVMGLKGGALADAVAATLVQPLDVRRQLLAELDPRLRLTQLVDWVSDQLAGVGVGRPSDPSH